MAGCTSKSHGPGGSASSPSARPPAPSPLPGTVAAAARERDLAAYASAALDHFGKHLTKPQRHLLSGLRDAHLAHAAVLGQVDPTVIKSTADPGASTGATTSPAPTRPASTASTRTSPSGSASTPALGHNPRSTLTALHRLETKASKAYAALALTPGDPSQGGLVLLWGSLATASAGYAALCASGADPGPAVIGELRVSVSLPDQVTAMAHLLSQCYAIIFGYQSAIAYLSTARAEIARDRLSDYRDLRDRLAGLLTDRKAAVPVPDAAYRLPVQPKSDSSATRLIAVMETRMLPFLGQWLATADADARGTALPALMEAARSDLGWSAEIDVWPGYPTG